VDLVASVVRCESPIFRHNFSAGPDDELSLSFYQLSYTFSMGESPLTLGRS
jgi:hypothetical protein